MAKIDELRTRHKTFTYQSYAWELINDTDLKLSFVYKISPDITFNPSATIHNVNQEMIDQLGKNKVDSYVFQIGLADFFSYWKATASKEIMIEAGSLKPSAIRFWHKLLLKGMGEFFYQNQIDFSDHSFVNIKSESGQDDDSEQPAQTWQINEKDPRVLIPIGGGKDSALTLELLKKHFDVGTLTISTPRSAQDVIDVSKVEHNKQIKVSRVLDPKIFELNEMGYLNGHVPISAYFAFLSLFTADLFGYSHVAISNERSSNEGNVWYCDQEVNHQYSKTYEFERDLQAYVANFLPQNSPFYFSFLRPLYELQIAQLFAKIPDYHPVIRSCNKGQKQNTWCGNCSKCLFSWTILYPFLDPEKITSYFNKNLFEDESLWQIAQELLGLTSTKPFDCVGTHEETIIAFYLCLQSYKKSGKSLPVLLQKIGHELESNPKLKNGPIAEISYEKRAQQLLNSWNSQNSLPDKFADILKMEIKQI